MVMYAQESNLELLDSAELSEKLAAVLRGDDRHQETESMYTDGPRRIEPARAGSRRRGPAQARADGPCSAEESESDPYGRFLSPRARGRRPAAGGARGGRAPAVSGGQ